MIEYIRLINYQEIKDVVVELQKDLYIKPSKNKIEDLCNKWSLFAIFYVLREENRNIGYVSFYCNDKEKKIAYITMIVISQNYQHQGYGRLLLKLVNKIALSKGMRCIKLEVAKDNEKAKTLYKKMGYKEVSENENSYYYFKNL